MSDFRVQGVMETMYRISVPYACGGIIANDKDVVVVAAPIFKWMLGKKMAVVHKWLLSKSGSIKIVERDLTERNQSEQA